MQDPTPEDLGRKPEKDLAQVSIPDTGALTAWIRRAVHAEQEVQRLRIALRIAQNPEELDTLAKRLESADIVEDA